MIAIKELFGIRVRSLRRRKNWTQEYLSEKMDISPNYLSSIERGQENPTFDMLIKLSDALKADLWELFDFGHEVDKKDLKGILNKFIKEIDEEKLRLAIKILRAMAR
jgi:transcriptional regulator with XRE-family HTH domain